MRLAKFSAVGALGVAVQMGCLSVLIYGLGIHYLLATVVALEVTILHNFAWHWRWTWADRTSADVPFVSALWRFHVTNGAVSFAGNVLLMRLLAGAAGMEPLLANGVSIIACALLNFFFADRLVFSSSRLRAARQ